MCAAGSLAAVLSRLCLASVKADLTVTPDVLLGHEAESIAAYCVVAISVAGVAIVAVSIAVIAVGNPVINQGAVLVLTELADQLGFQS